MANDDGLILTDEQMKRVLEVYLSGFTSGISSAAITAGMPLDAAQRISGMITSSLQEDHVAMADVRRVITACLNDEDADDSPVRVVDNVFHRP